MGSKSVQHLTKHLEGKKRKKRKRRGKPHKASGGKCQRTADRRPEDTLSPPLPSGIPAHSLSSPPLLSLHSSHASANGSKKSNSKPRLEAPHRGDDARSRAPLRRRRLLLVPVPRRNGLPHPAPAGRPSTGRAERGTHPSGRWSLSLVWCW